MHQSGAATESEPELRASRSFRAGCVCACYCSMIKAPKGAPEAHIRLISASHTLCPSENPFFQEERTSCNTACKSNQRYIRIQIKRRHRAIRRTIRSGHPNTSAPITMIAQEQSRIIGEEEPAVARSRSSPVRLQMLPLPSISGRKY